MSVESSQKTASRWNSFILGAVIIFLVPKLALAQGVQLSLKNPSHNGFTNHLTPPTPGLSIVFESLPLLKPPAKVTRKVYCSEDHSAVYINHKVGETQLLDPASFDLERYLKYSSDALLEKTWKERSTQALAKTQDSKAGGSLLQYEIPFKFPKLISSIIGEGGPSLQVNGYRRISFAGRSQWIDGLKSTATNRQSKFPSLTMEQKSAFTVNGKVGSKISVKVDENSQRQSDLENRIQIRYTGEENEIIQSVDLGNTNLSIGGANFVGYSQNIQGLFGIKAKAKVGGLDLTVITSQQKGATQKDRFLAGAKREPIILRDYEYWPNTFFFLGRPIPVDSATGMPRTDGKNNSRFIRIEGFGPQDSIISYIDVYISNISLKDSTAFPYSLAVVNPDSLPDTSSADFDEWEFNRFRRLESDKYFVEKNQFWIKLNQRLNPEDVLAVYVEVRQKSGSIDSIRYIGKLDYDNTKDPDDSARDTTNILKLIKDYNPQPNYTTWNYEWKNVYYLGATNIDRDGFKLDIYKGKPDAENLQVDKNSQDTIPYIRILGLDRFDLSGQPKPDNLVDLSQIDLYQGYLYFPQLQPFAADTSYNGNMNDTLAIKIDTIYKTTILEDKNLASQYYIYFEGATRQTEYYLGRSPILEGSEVVTLNGRVLTRGVDYNIIYEIGQVIFLNREISDPNAEVNIDYEYAPIFLPEKKTLFGIQAGQVFSSHFRLNFNALYSAEKSSETRPRVGQESSRNFVWDTNFGLDLSPGFLTKLTDAIPFVQATAPSKFQLTAEVAQSLPNPNLRNKVYIDDFEAVQDFTDLGIRRGTWTQTSPPDGKLLFERGRLNWYNPWNQVVVQEIWPERQTLNTENKVNVLNLQFTPDSSLAIPASSWGGIMRPIFGGSQNQTKTKYLEIWVKGFEGILKVDLGRVSEDIDQDGFVNTEDKPRNGIRDGLLDDNEDTGLDTLLSTSEPGYNSSTNPDPNDDDWDYTNREDYSKINGTEGNRNDPDRGRRPDTEDINTNNGLDVLQSYFEFSIDLSDTVLFKVPGTQNKLNGWRLYRIPLRDSTLAQNSGNYREVNTPDWTQIHFARIWLSGSNTATLVQIASLQLVGNRWQNLPITVKDTNDVVQFEEKFDIAVVNTHDNSNYYDPPPGVAGNLDRNTNVREKEQSLALVYEELRPGHTGSAYRSFFGAEDYTLYNKLKMFVHGPNSSDKVSFFLRIGQDSTNYYEYHTTVYPGWDARNEVAMDFVKMTGLKSFLLERLAQDPTAARETTDANYTIKGNPSLSVIRWFVVGVTNQDSVPVTGEIWIDELTSTDVRRTPGWAQSVNLTAAFSDFVSISGTFRKVDSEFHNLGAKGGSGVNETFSSFQISNFSLSKFLPPDLGLNLPMTYSWQRFERLPRLRVGSDIVLPKELRAEESSEQTTQSFSFSPSFTKNTNNWLLNLTARRISFGYNYSQVSGRSPATPIYKTRNYGMSLGYDLSPRKEHSFSLLKWLSFLPDNINNTKFSLLPKNLKFGGSLSANRIYQVNSSDVVTSVYNRSFNGSIEAGMNPLKSMNLNYNFHTVRDLRDGKTINFSLNPKKAKLGIELNRKQTFSSSLNPKWFGFLDQTFTYRADYAENSDPNQNLSGGRVVNNGSYMGLSGTFHWKKLISGLLPKGKPPQTPTDKPPAKTPETPKVETKPQTQGSPGMVKRFFGFIFGLPGKVNPISFSWSKDKNFRRAGLLERPGLAYQFGFSDDPGVKVISDPQLANSDGGNLGRSYSFSSGAPIAKGMDLRFGYSFRYGRTQSASEPTFSKSRSYPDLTFNWSGLEKFKYIKKWVSSAAFQFSYAHKIDESGNQRTQELNSRGEGTSFSPLVGLNLRWKNGVTSNLRVDKTTTTGSDLRAAGGNQAVTKNDNLGVTVSSSYAFKAPQGIKFFFLKGLKFESNLSLGLDISYRSGLTKTSVQGKEFNITRNTVELSIAPRASYNFSSQINGGLQGRWVDQHNKKDGTKLHSRELSFWIELRF